MTAPRIVGFRPVPHDVDSQALRRLVVGHNKVGRTVPFASPPSSLPHRCFACWLMGGPAPRFRIWGRR